MPRARTAVAFALCLVAGGCFSGSGTGQRDGDAGTLGSGEVDAGEAGSSGSAAADAGREEATDALSAPDSSTLPDASMAAPSDDDASTTGDGAFDGPTGTGLDGGGATDGSTPFGLNLVSDPAWWNLTGGATVTAMGTLTTAGSDLCVTNLVPQSMIVLGWGVGGAPPLSLTTGTSYTLAYQAYVTLATGTVDAKIGEVMQPFTADFESSTDPVAMSPQLTSHTFTAGRDDPAAGIAFLFTPTVAGQAFCLSSVVFTHN